MATKTPKPDPKTEALRRRSALNPRPESVTEPLFQNSDFFDSRDLVQVKYEMLRRVRVEACSVTESALAFGFSRPSFYQAQSAFAVAGLGGLLPKKPGPRRAHKLSAEVVAFLEHACAAEPSLRTVDLIERVQERFDLRVHGRSIERGLARSKKKHR
jgi:transposase